MFCVFMTQTVCARLWELQQILELQKTAGRAEEAESSVAGAHTLLNNPNSDPAAPKPRPSTSSCVLVHPEPEWKQEVFVALAARPGDASPALTSKERLSNRPPWTRLLWKHSFPKWPEKRGRCCPGTAELARRQWGQHWSIKRCTGGLWEPRQNWWYVGTRAPSWYKTPGTGDDVTETHVMIW